MKAKSLFYAFLGIFMVTEASEAHGPLRVGLLIETVPFKSGVFDEFSLPAVSYDFPAVDILAKWAPFLGNLNPDDRVKYGYKRDDTFSPANFSVGMRWKPFTWHDSDGGASVGIVGLLLYTTRNLEDGGEASGWGQEFGADFSADYSKFGTFKVELVYRFGIKLVNEMVNIDDSALRLRGGFFFTTWRSKASNG